MDGKWITDDGWCYRGSSYVPGTQVGFADLKEKRGRIMKALPVMANPCEVLIGLAVRNSDPVKSKWGGEPRLAHCFCRRKINA